MNIFITQPDTFLAEGQITLTAENIGSDGGDGEILALAHHLIRTVLGDAPPAGPRRTMTSLNLQRLGTPVAGAIYGQVHPRRWGETVSFLVINIFDSRGEKIYTGTATGHVSS